MSTFSLEATPIDNLLATTSISIDFLYADSSQRHLDFLVSFVSQDQRVDLGYIIMFSCT